MCDSPSPASGSAETASWIVSSSPATNGPSQPKVAMNAADLDVVTR